MVAEPSTPETVAVTLPRRLRWTLHHVLLDRIERANENTHERSADVVPPMCVYRAFDRLDQGGTSFTFEELEAIQDVLASYQRSTDWWENERANIEALLATVSRSIERVRTDE